MKCDELKPVFVDMSGNIVANELGKLYYKPEVDAAIAEKDELITSLQDTNKVLAHNGVRLNKMLDEKDKEIALLKEHICNGDVSRLTWIDDCTAKDKEIAELKQKLENVQASMYADVVYANMENRRLRRALYKAIANWAKCEERINNRDAYESSEYLPSAEDKFRKKAERWSEIESKCRAKAEEYK